MRTSCAGPGVLDNSHVKVLLQCRQGRFGQPPPLRTGGKARGTPPDLMQYPTFLKLRA